MSKVVEWQDQAILLDDKFSAKVYNPKAPGCPKIGDVIHLAGHAHLHDGLYLVIAVVEYIPANAALRSPVDGRDIRLSLWGEHDPHVSNGWVAYNVMKAMVEEDADNIG